MTKTRNVEVDYISFQFGPKNIINKLVTKYESLMYSVNLICSFLSSKVSTKYLGMWLEQCKGIWAQTINYLSDILHTHSYYYLFLS